MQIGAVYPQTELDTDPETVSTFVTTVEDRGYDFLLCYDHVVGANPDDPTFDGPFDNDDALHEPLTLFAHLAAVTDSIRLVTGILILPQRQTALAAKQTATVDVLCDGRLRLGVGVGWNEREYAALGVDFGDRGPRIEEQLEVLRRLWTEEAVWFDGRWHHLPNVGINPRPVQRPIPVWMGGEAPPVLERVGRLADGWIPPGRFATLEAPIEEAAERVESIRAHARDAGRDPDELRIVARVEPTEDATAWVERIGEWRALGATHVAIDAVGTDRTVEEHLDLVDRFARRMEAAGIREG